MGRGVVLVRGVMELLWCELASQYLQNGGDTMSRPSEPRIMPDLRLASTSIVRSRQVLPPCSVTRAQAADMTHGHILDMVPAGRQVAARATFQAYCTAFNRAFPLLYPNLFECTANPFLDAERKVDLSGLGMGGPGMGPEISLAFSLPSRQRGETDARGLCTLQLVEALASAHNDLLTALRATFETSQRASASEHRDALPASGGDMHEDENEAFLHLLGVAEEIDSERDDEEEELRAGRTTSIPPLRVADLLRLPKGGHTLTETAPVVDYRTPADAIRSHLLAYDRDRDLLPLLFAFADGSQGKEGGDSRPIRYDFGAVERGLRRRILDGKRAINVVVGREKKGR